MSAIVCGKRSSFFEDLASSPPVAKRIRCSSSSPVRFSPPRTTAGSPSSSQSPFNLSSFSSHFSALDHLSALFPDMDKQLLERALQECGDDLDLAIRSLNGLQLGSTENLGSDASKCYVTHEENVQFQAPGVVNTNGEVASAEDPSAPQNLPMGGADWVELFVREMTNASNMDDARARASRALEVLEKSIRAHATADAIQAFQQENIMLKEQVEALIHENALLKRAVTIQHERQKECEDRSEELHNLKQMVSQYQEQLRTLEVNNYALTMHLKQTQQSNSIPGRFHPDVF
ncbi:Immunoglobulin A1 protease [Actinidia chinensis var. chinensis]|uniref:Immunoglobulin A1 protease n=1 Tax=Actinidia chinensis var. chinensis TaxID=1590841 RepID=A0A2R6R4J9_ACTCC|nr:Immunoglobulin A1 protease [Actinidia chinensis var. chinensis]